MSPEGFKEYKHLILDNLEQFKSCREAHQDEFKQIHSDLNAMKKEILSETKSISEALGSMKERLITVEVKSGLWGLLSGLVPFAIYFFINHK